VCSNLFVSACRFNFSTARALYSQPSFRNYTRRPTPVFALKAARRHTIGRIPTAASTSRTRHNEPPGHLDIHSHPTGSLISPLRTNTTKTRPHPRQTLWPSECSLPPSSWFHLHDGLVRTVTATQTFVPRYAREPNSSRVQPRPFRRRCPLSSVIVCRSTEAKNNHNCAAGTRRCTKIALIDCC
jgi:hypothetical protein